jgi:hypothetical protein
MIKRSEGLEHFVQAASVAFRQFARNPDSSRTVEQVFGALDTTSAQRVAAGSRLPACAHLPAALSVATHNESLRVLLESFGSIESQLQWRRRAACDGSESVNFPNAHANTTIIGPDGLEDREDVWLGVSLLAPHVRYPDHNHPPEEVYLALSDGQWRQDDGAWFTPGIGGSFYNRPGIKHAMRSLDTPLFAFWLLRLI